MVSDEQDRRACVNCHGAKRQCDRNYPCTRCQRMGKVCDPYIPKPRKRRRGEIVTSACVGCKIAKSKCESTRPCQRCVRKKLCCNSSKEQPIHDVSHVPEEISSEFKKLESLTGDLSTYLSIMNTMAWMLPSRNKPGTIFGTTTGVISPLSGSQSQLESKSIYFEPVNDQSVSKLYKSAAHTPALSGMGSIGVVVIEYVHSPPGVPSTWLPRRSLNNRAKELLQLTPEQLKCFLEYDFEAPGLANHFPGFLEDTLKDFINWSDRPMFLANLSRCLHSPGVEHLGEMTYNRLSGTKLRVKYALSTRLNSEGALSAVVYAFAPIPDHCL